ncbi:hypothetical protein [Sphingomonas echinoides]|uniref:hypothetical protein n=1 Tax=Sphingomonas echinoides TaxID=59803 RepID=UPI0024134DE4|nr:hypothetical protein [Sphingomonas echinoides]
MGLLTKITGLAIAGALVLPFPASSRDRDDWHRDRNDWHRDHRHHDDDSAAVGVALGIGLIGIAAAVAAKNKRRADDERNAYEYGYGGSYGGNAFSPAPDVNCYSRERRCYVRGQFSYAWTDRQFSYDPYRRGY